MISLLSDDPFFHLVVRDLSTDFEILKYLYLNDIILKEATDVFFSFVIFVISL